MINKNILENIPELPGCYIWKDKNNKILYIGKAKNLKKRINQYFSKVFENKTAKLISKIENVEYIIVENENEALILENNLIKENKPPYNILLKEGSNSYPYIVLTDEKHPRIIYTRRYNLYKGKHYGPFATTENSNAYSLYLLLNKMFSFRKCNKIPNKECLYYHLGQCIGPCINQINLKTYDEMKKNIDDIFNNHIQNKLKELKKLEIDSSEKLEFEKSKMYFEYANQLRGIIRQEVVELKQKLEADIIGYYASNGKVCIMIFNFVNGKLLSKHEFISYYYDELNDEITSYLSQYYSEHIQPKYIYIKLDKDNFNLLSATLNSNLIIPQKGEKLNLIISAIKNAKNFLENNDLEFKSKNDRTIGAQEELANLLKIDNLNHIDIIDNSNLFLENCVSAVVVYKNAQPIRKLYRKYNLKTTEKKSDYYFMKEVIIRKYSKNTHFPDLLIVDGGKSQVSIAYQTLIELELDKIITVIGLKKNKKHITESIITTENKEIKLEKNSGLYFFLSNMQNEVHRYVIEFYRNKSSKSKTSQFLDNISGIGYKTKEKILKIYPNIYDLKNVDLETIAQILPKKIALILKKKIDEELK